MKKHGVPDEDFYRGPIGDGMESERDARIAELERVLESVKSHLLAVLWQTDSVTQALSEIKSVLGKKEAKP